MVNALQIHVLLDFTTRLRVVSRPQQNNVQILILQLDNVNSAMHPTNYILTLSLQFVAVLMDSTIMD